MQKLIKQSQIVKTVVNTVFRVKIHQNPVTLGSWLVNEFQQLGPTYIKIGQFISSRKDIFGTDFSLCFDVLRDRVNPIPKIDIDELLLPVKDALFVEDKHMASASIGQVHKAKSKKSGKELIVKIKRPNIEKTIHDDLDFLKNVVQLMINFDFYNAKNTMVMLKEFEEYLLQEVDFELEAQNLKLFYDTYAVALDQKVKIPYFVSKLSSKDIIVMEYVFDIGLDNYNGDKKAAARMLMNFFIKQLVDYGVIHGDPHKGNIGITPDGRVILYDFGSIITFDKEERYVLKELVYMLIVGNKSGIMKLLTKLGVEIVDREALNIYIDKYIQYMRTIDINVFKTIQTDNFELPLKLNGKVFRLLRVYGILEGICKELDPEFNYFDLFDDYVTSLALDEDFLVYKMKQDMITMQGSFGKAIFDFFDVK
jgi:predicted unusual protein kinase regulating ubiquinone biosynthesis (AarF/ABC1/UbiB family)